MSQWLREKLSENEELFLKNGWSVMPKGEVEDESSFYKIFKYSDKADLCAVLEIKECEEEREEREEKKYGLVFHIEDLLGKQIAKSCICGQGDEIARWLERC